MKKQFTVHSLKETEQLAKNLALLISPPDVITLEGDLGAGKTAFTQAFARAIGIKRTVSSPTFTILKQYEGKFPFNHLDVYRLAGSDEDLGWEELFYGDAVTIIEWAHLIEEDLPENRLEIEIFHAENSKRIITVKPQGERYEKICEGLSL